MASRRGANKGKPNFFQRIGNAFKSAWSDGYQFGDITNSLIAGITDSKSDNYDYLQGGSLSLVNHWFGVDDDPSTELLGQAQTLQDSARQQYLEDREHTEAREDSVYQRGVEDMRKAGLNPYTIGANPSPSSPSTVGENSIMSKIQMLGYVLDLKNLSYTNKSIANKLLGTIITAVAK